MIPVAAAVVAIGMASYAWWAVGLAPFSGTATAAVLAAGAVAIAAGALVLRPRSPSARAPKGTARWMALLAAAAVWQFAAFVQHPRDDHPTLSSLTNALLDSQVARAAAFVGWVAAAAALVRR
ncbi:MAG: hypothetical protein ACRD2C_09730 [Acidimicrobiales bacterium]